MRTTCSTPTIRRPGWVACQGSCCCMLGGPIHNQTQEPRRSPVDGDKTLLVGMLAWELAAPPYLIKSPTTHPPSPLQVRNVQGRSLACETVLLPSYLSLLLSTQYPPSKFTRKSPPSTVTRRLLCSSGDWKLSPMLKRKSC